MELGSARSLPFLYQGSPETVSLGWRMDLNYFRPEILGRLAQFSQKIIFIRFPCLLASVEDFCSSSGFWSSTSVDIFFWLIVALPLYIPCFSTTLNSVRSNSQPLSMYKKLNNFFLSFPVHFLLFLFTFFLIEWHKTISFIVFCKTIVRYWIKVTFGYKRNVFIASCYFPGHILNFYL